MLAVSIVVIVALALFAAWLADMWEAGRLAELEERDRLRAELAELNDGSWPAFLAEMYDTTTVDRLQGAA